MKKIDLTPYVVKVDGGEDLTINMKDNLISLVYGQNHTGPELLKRFRLVTKLEKAGDAAYVEGAEYDLMHEIVTETPTFSRVFVEFVERILDAPEVEVEEKQ